MQPENGTNQSARLELNIVLGENIQSFKNKKRTVFTGVNEAGKNVGKTMTAKKTKAQMARLTAAIESALCSEFLTRGAETGTGCNLQSWIALSVPGDDSLKWIPEWSGGVEYVEPGQEGVKIIIEKIE